eukprot:365252-Chlamydomonas_euryale.AAC.6
MDDTRSMRCSSTDGKVTRMFAADRVSTGPDFKEVWTEANWCLFLRAALAGISNWVRSAVTLTSTQIGVDLDARAGLAACAELNSNNASPVESHS